MAENGTAHASGRVGFFNKCYLAGLIALLVGIAATFLFFALMRQTHPSDRPAQKTEITRPAVYAPAGAFAA